MTTPDGDDEIQEQGLSAGKSRWRLWVLGSSTVVAVALLISLVARSSTAPVRLVSGDDPTSSIVTSIPPTTTTIVLPTTTTSLPAPTTTTTVPVPQHLTATLGSLGI